MRLIAVYLVLMITGSLVAYGLGLVVEQPHLLGCPSTSPQTMASLTVFLAAYFINLWVAWQIAVRVTQPKEMAS